jgi:hypothetical protein
LLGLRHDAWTFEADEAASLHRAMVVTTVFCCAIVPKDAIF